LRHRVERIEAACGIHITRGCGERRLGAGHVRAVPEVREAGEQLVEPALVPAEEVWLGGEERRATVEAHVHDPATCGSGRHEHRVVSAALVGDRDRALKRLVEILCDRVARAVGSPHARTCGEVEHRDITVERSGPAIGWKEAVVGSRARRADLAQERAIRSRELDAVLLLEHAHLGLVERPRERVAVRMRPEGVYPPFAQLREFRHDPSPHPRGA
jgi:hypothetical protein